MQYFGRRSLGDLDPANYFHSLAASKAKGYLGLHQRSTSRLSILSDPREPIESLKKRTQDVRRVCQKTKDENF